MSNNFPHLLQLSHNQANEMFFFVVVLMFLFLSIERFLKVL